MRDVTWTDPQSGFYASMSAPVNITGFQTVVLPPHARQAGCSTTSCQIDTGDGRFVSPSTQINDDLWNTTTFGFAGFVLATAGRTAGTRRRRAVAAPA